MMATALRAFSGSRLADGEFFPSSALHIPSVMLTVMTVHELCDIHMEGSVFFLSQFSSDVGGYCILFSDQAGNPDWANKPARVRQR